MTTAKIEAICDANARLNNVGLPTYTELVGLLNEVSRLGLHFDVGSAYIRRAYIDKQDALLAQVSALNKSLPSSTVAHAELIQSS